MRALYIFVLGITLWASSAKAQQSVLSSSDCAGSWYLDSVAFSEHGMEFLRKEIGTENGIFSQERYDKNWSQIQGLIKTRAYLLGIWPGSSHCPSPDYDSTEDFTDAIAFNTAVNSCSGCGTIANGILKIVPQCTKVGCDIEGVIFHDLRGSLPVHLLGDMLVIGARDSRCMYFLKKNIKK